MEKEIPKEVRDYSESIFMGLNLKQCIMSAIALLLAVPVFMLLQPKIGTESASLIGAAIAAPIGAVAFIKVKGLSLFRFIIAFAKWFITPNHLVYQQKNMYMEAITKLRLEERPDAPAKEEKNIEAEVSDEQIKADH